MGFDDTRRVDRLAQRHAWQRGFGFGLVATSFGVVLGAVGIVTVPGIVVDKYGDRIYALMRQEPQIASWRIAVALVGDRIGKTLKHSQNRSQGWESGKTG